MHRVLRTEKKPIWIDFRIGFFYFITTSGGE